MDRRNLFRFTTTGAVMAIAGTSGVSHAQPPGLAESSAFSSLQSQDRLSIGIVIFPEMDQIDFTGPFEVLVRLPGAKVHVLGTQKEPFRDFNGLILSPDLQIQDSPEVDLLVIPGGPGQQAVMNDEQLLAMIRNHHETGKPIYSVCTGALICGAAGILKGRRVTTHWSTIHLLPLFGAITMHERVVFDGNIASAAGVTAGIDGALWVAALLRGEKVAQEIQLGIQYAPEPPFQSGLPDTAPPDVLKSVEAKISGLSSARLETARQIATKLGIARR